MTAEGSASETTPDMAALCPLCARGWPAYRAGGAWWHDEAGNDDQQLCVAGRLREWFA